jgi:predicted nucleotidyltransferase
MRGPPDPQRGRRPTLIRLDASLVAIWWYNQIMSPAREAHRREVLKTLKALEPELRAEGVRHISVFGSVARGEDTLASDVDLALDLAPGAAPTGFQFVTYVDRLRRRLASALSRNVDIVILPARRRELEVVLRREAIAAF